MYANTVHDRPCRRLDDLYRPLVSSLYINLLKLKKPKKGIFEVLKVFDFCCVFVMHPAS